MATDTKYRNTLHKLPTINNFHLLRYGDYLKQSLHCLRKESQKKVRKENRLDKQASVSWENLDEELKEKKEAMKKFHEVGWWIWYKVTRYYY